MFDFIANPLGQILLFIYNNLSFANYGLAIIIFTVIIKLILLPLTVKQYKSTAKMQVIQPQIQEIQKRYKNDKEKLNQELMKVYQENKVNPAGGCLPLLIQMPILFSLFYVLREPLKFMYNKTPEVIEKIMAVVPESFTEGFYKQVGVMNYLNQFPEKIQELGLENLITRDEVLNLNFIGLNLGVIPSYKWADITGDPSTYIPLLLLVVIGVVITFISSKMTMPKKKDDNKNNKSAGAGMQNSMLYMGPIMTLIFSFSLPAGVVLYWIAGYIFQIFQQLYINKHIIDNKEVSSN